MKRCRRPLLAGVLVLLRGASLWAMGSPPLITDDPGTPGPGRWEINVGVTTERRPGERAAELPLIDLNYGIGETVQLKYEVPYLVQEQAGQPRDSRFGDSALGVKWRFHDSEKDGTTVSVYPQLQFNNPGSSSDERGLVEHGAVFLLPLQLQKNLGGVTLNLQLGREFRSTESAWLYGMALSHQLRKNVEIAVELAGAAAARLDRSQLTLNGGVVFEVSERCSVMFSVGRELHNHTEPRATLITYAGCQWRL